MRAVPPRLCDRNEIVALRPNADLELRSCLQMKRSCLQMKNLCRKILAFTKMSTKDIVLPKEMGYYHLEWERSNTFKAIISSMTDISVDRKH